MSDSGGTIRTQYVIDFAQTVQAAAQIRAALGGIQQATTPLTDAEVKYAQAVAKTTQAQAQAATAFNKRIESEAKAAQATAQSAFIDQKRATEAAKTAAADDKAAVAALRRGQAEEKAAKQAASGAGGGGAALPRTFAGFTPQGFNQALGAFGLAQFGPQIVGKVIGEGVQAGQEALALRETRNSLKAVAGDTKTYTTILQEARNQQLLFGGSLSELTEGLSGFAVTARNTGAPLNQLIDLQKRLTILNPAQGAQGGLIALNEALAGNITSLSRRFNIPKAALQELNDTTKPAAERLKVLDEFLNKVGVTSAAVTDRVDQDAQAFRRLGQSLGDLKLNVGNELATAFSGTATGLARIVGLINQNPQAIAELKAILGRKGEVTQTDLDQATRQVAENQAKQQLSFLEGRQRLAGSAGIHNEDIHLAKEQLTELNLAGGVAADQGARLTQAFEDGSISIKVYRSGLTALVSELQVSGDVEGLRAQRLAGLTKAQDDAAEAARKQTQALIDNISKSQLASQESQKLGDFQKTLAGLGDAVANGMETSGAAALSLAAQYGIAIDKAQNLVNLQSQLANKPITEGRSERDTPQDLAQARTAGLQLIRDQADAQAQAARDRLNAIGTTAQKLAQAQKDAADTTTPLAKYEAQTRVLELQQQLAQEQLKTGKSLTSEAEKRQRAEEATHDAQQKQIDAALRLEKIGIDDERADAKDAKDKARLEAALASGRQTAPREAAIRLRLREIAVDDQIREQEKIKAGETAGGTITAKGALLQSKPRTGAGLPPAPVSTTTGGLPIPSIGATAPAPLGAQTIFNLTVNVDKAGRVSATSADPNLTINVLAASAAQQNASGG